MSSFAKNIGVVSVASGASFALSLLLTPLMTRAYGPSDYGLFAVINNFATLLSSLTILSLPNVLPIEKEVHKRVQVIRSLMQLLVFTFVITSIGVLIYLFTISARGGTAEVQWAVLLLPVLVAAISLQKTAQGRSIAMGEFKSMSLARVLHPIIAKPAAIAMAMIIGSYAFSLVIFEAIGYLVQSRTMLGQGWRRILFTSRLLSVRRFHLTVIVVARNKSLTLYDNFSNLAVLASISFQTIIVTSSFSLDEAGYFSLALSMVALPIQLLSLATAAVIYQKLIHTLRANPDIFFRRIIQIALIYFVIGLIPYVAVYFAGPQLFNFAFGEKWRTSGLVATTLSLPLFLHFILTPIVSVFRVTGRTKLGFIIDVLLLSISAVVFMVASRNLNFLQAIGALAVSLSVCRIVQLGACMYVAWCASMRTDLEISNA